LRCTIFGGLLVKRTILSAAAVFAVVTVAHADELADIQAQSKELREQNQALTKRIADLEKRQRKLEAQPAKQPAVAARPANPSDSMAADLAYKAAYKKAPVDDSLTWHGITLYGLVDMGVTYGRQNALTSDGVINYDPMSNSGAFSLIGFQGATGGAGDTEDRIFDNSFKYAVNVGPFRAAVEAELRSGAFSDPGNAIEAQVGGDYAGLSVDAIFSHVTDAITSAPLPVGTLLPASLINPGNGFVSGTVSDNTSVMLLAKYTYGPVKFYAGYEHMDFANPNNPLTTGSLITGGYSLGLVNNTAFATDKILQVFWGGARYAVRSDVDLMVAYYHEEQNSFEGGTVATANLGHCTNNSLAQCSGQLDAASAVIDYRFAKRFDAYAGIMWSQVSNGLANGFLQRSSIDPTVGLRFQF
jgi:predicted porin